ncbi:MAG: hypothetical protein NTY32_12655 [Bacteroidia bacterium]|nr:hypothetical protein [Bacteroidia bacterium]
MKKLASLVVFLVLSFTISAQVQKMLDILEDTDTETNDGKYTLRFFHALNGQAVEGASISIPGIGDFKTDLAGKVQFPMVKDGKYPFRFSKEGFITATYSFEAVANTIFFNRFTVSPRMELGYMRLVLVWDSNPADLDLHLVKEGVYHISYRNLKRSEDGTVVLDRDDTDGYGPETVTLSRTDNQADYTCFVHDYTNGSSTTSRQLSASKASIYVYNNNELIKVYPVPIGAAGNSWAVFQLKAGQIKDVNVMGNSN